MSLSIPNNSTSNFSTRAIACTEMGTCALSCANTAVDLYLSGIDSGNPLRNTPFYVNRFIHPGRYYTPSGTGGIMIQKPEDLSDTKLIQGLDAVRTIIAQNPAVKNQIKQDCPSNPDTKGCPLSIPGSERWLLFNVPKQKMKSHIQGLGFLRSWVGKIDTLSEEEIVSNIKTTHQALCSTTRFPGNFRTSEIVVFRDIEEDQDRSPENMCRLILKRGGTEKDVQFFLQYAQKETPKRMTSDERKACAYLGYVPPYPEEVKEKMLEFARDLKEALFEMKQCGRIDPIALASFAHKKMGEIHPFTDGNGRLARALMNAILMEYGIQPVVFLNDAEYTEVVETDAKTPGHFSKYLEETILPRLRDLGEYLYQ